jgi:hypothetical protein
MNAKTKSQGGTRPGAGRPREPNARRNTVCVRLNDEELAFAERIGWGRAGEGLRTALQFAQTVDGGWSDQAKSS